VRGTPATDELHASAGHGAVQSPPAAPSPRKRRCRAKALRNHNPRVGGSSPSSGIRIACKSGPFCAGGTRGIHSACPGFVASGFGRVPWCREYLADISVPRAVPRRATQRGGAGDPPTAGPRPRTVPRSTCSRAASRARRRSLFPFVEDQQSNLSSCCSSEAAVSTGGAESAEHENAGGPPPEASETPDSTSR
jgi:hypothetical protein